MSIHAICIVPKGSFYMNTMPPVPDPAAGPAYPRWSETLRDGSRVDIRPITKEDAALEREFIEALSPHAKRCRFLGQVRTPSEGLLRQLTDIDYLHEAAFAAVVPADGRERIVGVSRYSADKDRQNCECAVTVADEWQHRGLGSALMRHLVDVAKNQGIKKMMSIDSADNVQMRELAAYLGFKRRADPDDASQVIHELEL